MDTKITLIISIILISILSCNGRYLNNEEASRRIIFNINSNQEMRSKSLTNFLQNNPVSRDIHQILVGLSQAENLPSQGATMSLNRMGFELREIIRRKAEERRMSQIASIFDSNSQS